MPVQPVAAWHEGGKAHPRVQGDAGLLRQLLDGHEFPYRFQNPLEGVPHTRHRPGEMPLEIAERAACVDLVPVRERAPALLASPHGGHAYSLAQLPPTGHSMRSALPAFQWIRVDATVRADSVGVCAQRPALTSTGAGSWPPGAGARRALTPSADRAPATDMNAAAA